MPNPPALLSRDPFIPYSWCLPGPRLVPLPSAPRGHCVATSSAPNVQMAWTPAQGGAVAWTNLPQKLQATPRPPRQALCGHEEWAWFVTRASPVPKRSEVNEHNRTVRGIHKDVSVQLGPPHRLSPVTKPRRFPLLDQFFRGTSVLAFSVSVASWVQK